MYYEVFRIDASASGVLRGVWRFGTKDIVLLGLSVTAL